MIRKAVGEHSAHIDGPVSSLPHNRRVDFNLASPHSCGTPTLRGDVSSCPLTTAPNRLGSRQ